MSSKHHYPKPTHVYIGRASCGCCLALVNDDGNKFTGESVSGFIEEGLTVSHIKWQHYVDVVSREPGFMQCIHKGPKYEQVGMFDQSGKA